MKFDNVRIGKKLGIGFGVTVILMIVLCVVTILNSQLTNSLLTRLININMPKIKHAIIMKDAIDSITRSVAALPFATQEIAEEEQNKMLINRGRYKEAIESLEKLLETQEEKDLLNRFKEASKSGAVVNDKIIELVKEGKKQEAQLLYLNETRQTTETLVNAAASIIKNQEDRLEADAKSLQSYNRRLLVMALIVGAISIFIGIFMSIRITKSIKAPVEKVAEQLELMSKGDFAFSISQNAIGRGDELGIIARAMDALLTNLKNIFNEIISTVHSLTSSATQLSSIAEEMSRAAESSSSRANSVATASEEMSQTVVDIAKNTASIADSAKKAVDTAQQGNSIVERSVGEVREIDETVNESARFVKSLGERSAHIGEIVSVINDIADQTNL
ncbi:MAG: methyl-accepting chemotaxis protein, partial [Syntrophorhabdaceae bacterium]|nr:methyl-accepting chemotaxis protein [Syntrophorhabdaceae bacterium]